MFEELISFCKNRGFVYQSCSLYGGLQGFYDYGPLGVELKNKIKQSWWNEMVKRRSNVFGIDSNIILSDKVLSSSGHLDGFEDVFKDCRNCKSRFRIDEVKDVCLNPKCGSRDFTPEKAFNLMMKVNVGPTEGNYAYLRPETAQGIFINFKNVMDSFSPKLPFGIAQIGKAFRNEVTPKNFILKTREFEQMEMEFFIKPGDNDYYFEQLKEQRKQWWNKQGVEVVFYEQGKDELAHYSKKTTDIMCDFEGTLQELEGIADRQDFDLGSHTKAQSEFDIKAKVKPNTTSIDKLSHFQEKLIPHNIEVSAGVERAFLAILYSAYKKDGDRTVLKLPAHLAPFKAAIVPIVKNKEDIVSCAQGVFDKLQDAGILDVKFELTGNVGKSYAKHDEIGTLYCISVDHESVKDGTLTIRDRDTREQSKISIDKLIELLR
jgi:glycyl-tRNA synthetase